MKGWAVWSLFGSESKCAHGHRILDGQCFVFWFQIEEVLNVWTLRSVLGDQKCRQAQEKEGYISRLSLVTFFFDHGWTGIFPSPLGFSQEPKMTPSTLKMDGPSQSSWVLQQLGRPYPRFLPPLHRLIARHPRLFVDALKDGNVFVASRPDTVIANRTFNCCFWFP